MRIRMRILFVGILLACSTSPLTAQVLPPGVEVPDDAAEALPIWPDAPPGTVVSGAAEQTMLHPLNPRIRIVRNVEVPTLTVFLPEPGAGNGTAVIVAPGGGNILLSIDSEGYEVARWLRDRGVAAFVLRYRTRPTARDSEGFVADLQQLGAQLAQLNSMTPGELTDVTWRPAVDDGRQAIRLVRSRAAQWGIDPTKVGILGFSAGGFVVNEVAVEYDDRSRPDFAASIYAGLVQQVTVPSDAPPLFIAYSVDDPLMNGVVDVLSLFTAWRAARRPVEFHAYERGGHGFGMRPQDTTSDEWIDALGDWMTLHGMLPR